MTEKIKLLKEKAKINKKPLVFILVIAFLLVASTTYAFFTSTTSFYNKFQAMTYDVTLKEEDFTGDWGPKKVFIVNNESATPIVVRINYSEIWSKEIDGMLDFLSTKIGNKDAAEKEWGPDYKDFIDGNDGWYYYTKVLDAGESIQLLESVILDEDLVDSSPDAEKYRTYKYELTFYYEAIQASEAAVAEVWGKSIKISGDTVTWLMS